MSRDRPETDEVEQPAEARGSGDGDDLMYADAPWSMGWLRLVFPAVFLVYLVQVAQGVELHATGIAAVAGYATVVAFAVCYLVGMVAGWDGSRRRFWICYGLMLGLCALETLFAHQYAFGMVVYIVVLTVAEMGGRGLPVIVVMTLVATFLPALIPAWDTGINGDELITIPIVTIAMYGFFAVIRMNRALSAARAEVARLAAENERNRIARDLHDLLGHSLTTITVKAGLANRLVATDLPRATQEMLEVETLGRQSLADVREAIGNYRDVSLTGELATGRELLRAAGIRMSLPPTSDVVDPEHRDVFAWVVREGLTNVVRHARADTCIVTMGPTFVEIVDDGHAAGLGRRAGSGHGLDGLRERVTAAGGTMIAEPSFPSGWRLRVEMPEAVAPSSSATTDAPTRSAPA